MFGAEGLCSNLLLVALETLNDHLKQENSTLIPACPVVVVAEIQNNTYLKLQLKATAVIGTHFCSRFKLPHLRNVTLFPTRIKLPAACCTSCMPSRGLETSVRRSIPCQLLKFSLAKFLTWKLDLIVILHLCLSRTLPEKASA